LLLLLLLLLLLPVLVLVTLASAVQRVMSTYLQHVSMLSARKRQAEF
jgi:hypothetical protein